MVDRIHALFRSHPRGTPPRHPQGEMAKGLGARVVGVYRIPTLAPDPVPLVLVTSHTRRRQALAGRGLGVMELGVRLVGGRSM
jgi:hypothetical protein